MSATPQESVFRRRADVRYRRIHDESVVIRQTVGEVLVLNGVGGRVLELADGERSLTALVDVLEREFDGSRETIMSDVTRFATELEDAGLLERVKG